MRILLVEDDRKAARLLARGLQEEGFVVDVAITGEEGEEKATVNEYDFLTGADHQGVRETPKRAGMLERSILSRSLLARTVD